MRQAKPEQRAHHTDHAQQARKHAKASEQNKQSERSKQRPATAMVETIFFPLGLLEDILVDVVFAVVLLEDVVEDVVFLVVFPVDVCQCNKCYLFNYIYYMDNVYQETHRKYSVFQNVFQRNTANTSSV